MLYTFLINIILKNMLILDFVNAYELNIIQHAVRRYFYSFSVTEIGPINQQL